MFLKFARDYSVNYGPLGYSIKSLKLELQTTELTLNSYSSSYSVMIIVPTADMAIVNIQDSFEDVISDVESKTIQSESIWIARRFSSDEDHQEFFLVNVSLDSKGKIKFDSPDVTFSRLESHKYTVSIKGDTYELVAPAFKIDTAKEGVSAVAMTKNGQSLIVGNEKCDIVHYDTETKDKIWEVNQAHFGGILKLVVFPSDRVLLSVGMDFQTKLWSLDTTTTAATRTFVDQKKEITDAALIGNGRNFMTASRDGSVNLWECSTGSVVSKFQRIDNMADPCTSLTISTSSEKVALSDLVGGDMIFESEDKVVYVGYASGTIQQYSVGGHYQTPVKYHYDAGVSCLATFGDHVVAGYDNGRVVVWREMGSYLLELNEHYSVRNIQVEKWDGVRASMVVSNGPDLLLRITFDSSDGTFRYKFMVGLGELFRVSLITGGKGVVVATHDEIVGYK